MSVTFQNEIPFLPVNIPQYGVYTMNSVRNKDAFVYLCANEPCNPLATVGPECVVFQPHELVWVALNLVRYGFTSLNDGGGDGPVTAWVVAPFSVIQTVETRNGADHCLN